MIVLPSGTGQGFSVRGVFWGGNRNISRSLAVSSRPAASRALPSSSSIFSVHSRALLSLLPVTSQRLSELIATAVTPLARPDKTTAEDAGFSDFRSHSRTVLSELPVMSQWPLALIVTVSTLFSCPVNGRPPTRARASRRLWRATGTAAPFFFRVNTTVSMASKILLPEIFYADGNDDRLRS